jgi:hypothetical protein
MKESMLALIATAFVAHAAAAQALPAPNVPGEVRGAWRSRFPGIRTVAWKLKADHNYEAEFKSRGVDIAAKFTPAATWLETETAVGATALPAVVQATIARDFQGYRQIETQRLDRAETPALLYEVHLDNAKEVVKLQLDPAGAQVSKSSKPKAKPPGAGA